MSISLTIANMMGGSRSKYERLKGGYHEPFRHSFNRRHYRRGT
jgi:hypothetical protein